MDLSHSLKELFDPVTTKVSFEEQRKNSSEYLNNPANNSIKINLYLVRFNKNKRNSNFVMEVVDEGDLCNDFCNGFKSFCKEYSSYDCVDIDPFSKDIELNNYSFISYDNMNNEWDNLFKLIKENRIVFRDNKTKISEINLSIVKYELCNSLYYAIRLQNPNLPKCYTSIDLYFTDKESIKKFDTKSFFFMDTSKIDCIVKVSKLAKHEPEFYIFSQDNFNKIFNYNEFLKKESINFISKLKKNNIYLPFLGQGELLKNNLDFLSKSIEKYKIVYVALSKVSRNEDYLNVIINTPAKALKTSLLANIKANTRGEGCFTNEDFEDDCIKITDHNLKKVLKMLSLNYKYNFFTNKAIS